MKAAACAGLLLVASAGAAWAQPQRAWSAYPLPRVERAPGLTVFSDPSRQRDPTGILRGQGVSSRYGGMGNMGGGSGRSANTGIGLGGIGANQGARF